MTQHKRIAIIGCFGGKKELLDGQTIKTKILYQSLRKKTDWTITKVDTYYKRRPVRLLLRSVYALLINRDVIVLLSQKGRRIYFPLLSAAAKVLHVRVYHDIIGAKLPDYVDQYPSFRTYLNSFYVNWAETTRLKEALEERGIHNVEVLPNFKQLRIASSAPKRVLEEPYRLCTFSRVLREKGIEDAVNAVIETNKRMGRTVYCLDIYGPVDTKQVQWFEELKKSFPDCVRYCGTVSYDKSVETLESYFALLFPTRYYSEGLPGTIIDAYAAGLPVIASRWESFGDVVDEGITGYGYAFENIEELVQLLMHFSQSPKELAELSGNCSEKAEQYLPERVVGKLIRVIEEAQGKSTGLQGMQK